MKGMGAADWTLATMATLYEICTMNFIISVGRKVFTDYHHAQLQNKKNCLICIYGFLLRNEIYSMRVGRGSDVEGHRGIWAGAPG